MIGRFLSCALIVGTLAACGNPRAVSVAPAQSQEDQRLERIDCTAWYRGRPGRAGREVKLSVEAVQNEGTQRDSARFRQMAVRIRYFDDSYESPAFNVIVKSPGDHEDIAVRLYQLERVGEQGDPDTQGGPAAKPENEFVGGHGFTGLGYVFDPDSKAEIQYFCEAF